MNIELLKKHLQKNVEETAIEFQKKEDIVCSFETPILAYVDAEDPKFDALFARGMNDHPKKIYRPGKCLILHYTPYAADIVGRNEAADTPTEEWVRAYMESLWLAMELNRTIVKTLKTQGRLTSYMNNMMEWDLKTCRGSWSHTLAAAVGGVGTIGPAGSLIVNGRYGGRVGGIITDGLYAEPAEGLETIDPESFADEILRAWEKPECSREMIAACPGGAISEGGIDKFKCQEYCLKFNEYIPSSDVCGKCFKFGI
ncbi:MAG: hypothetical protein Q4D99_01815 [Bacillota bacterium]|nr:hypothetical protein [Bacillota bacterium]